MADNFSFDSLALTIFRYQYHYNPVYRQFVQLNGVDPDTVTTLTGIPFLPVGFFKTHRVLCENEPVQKIFESSGTSGQSPARHYVADLELYRDSFRKGFQNFYGDPAGWHILALLPAYLERENSSLVYMMNELIRCADPEYSGFFLHDLEGLSIILQQTRSSSKKCLLVGVTFALLDLAEKFPQDLRHVTIMETGGMKGRRKELLREDVHEILKNAFQVQKIHSEYGMTELLSQAYSTGDGIFRSPPWMKVLRREINDALEVSGTPGRGALNIIDLANIHSCSFIATDDVGYLREDGSFEVLGRTDNSDLRGCNLMFTSY